MLYVFAVFYLVAITAANLLTTSNPRWAVPNASVLIGLDLIARDRLHDGWNRHRVPKMAALILAGSLLSYLVNHDAVGVAKASAVAFGASFATDALVYGALKDRPWLVRANWSNVPAAAVDSVLFAWLAPFPADWWLVLGLFLAKVGGGAVWSMLLAPRAVRRAALAAG